MFERVRVGVIGCGDISRQYLAAAKSFPVLEVAACADLDCQRAREAAEKFSVPRACDVEELLADKSIQIVLNLTVPKAHVPVSLLAIESGKHVYVEKPLGINREEAGRLLAAAAKRNLRVGCAPDTFLGAGIQTARKLLDGGAIGRPVAFTAFMMSPGMESWHPNPDFFFQPGGGPMFDMGPYYLTALLNVLGPVRQITAAASIALPERTITHKDKQGNPGPLFGQKIVVNTPDHICATMQFESGCLGTIITSFATHFPSYDRRQPITIFGTRGTLRLPDPNGFDGPVSLRRVGDSEWADVPHEFVAGYGRSVGLADMAHAIRSGRPHRADAEIARAVLDLMQGFLDSAAAGAAYRPTAHFARPAPMPAELPFGTLDD